MDGAWSTYGEDERCRQGFVGRPQDKKYLEDTGVDWRIILKLSLEK